MNESDNPFLSGISENPHLPESGGAMETHESPAKRTLSAVTCQRVMDFLRKNLFVISTITAVSLGIMLGFVLRPLQMSPTEIKYFAFPGELLMRMLQMLVLPLIVSSLVSGISTLDTKATGKIGMRAAVLYMITTFIAVFIGILVVMILQPGRGKRETDILYGGSSEKVKAVDALLDLIRNMIPPNIVEACFKQHKTVYYRRPEKRAVNSTVDIFLESEEKKEEMVPTVESTKGVNVLGLVVFSMCFGVVIGELKQKGKVMRDFFECLNEAIMKMVAVVIWYTPIGILFMIAGKLLEMKDMAQVGQQLGMYTATVITGLLIHSIFVLPMMYFVMTHKSPFNYIGGVLQALLTALGTSSSSATLPITIQCLEENNGLDKRVTRFVVPVGATINMDGTALYEAVAAIFIAQVNNLNLNFGQILTVSITATAASVGAAGIPQAGLVTMVIVLTSVGLPTEDIALIVAVDWFLDRLRTVTNVFGDSVVAGIVNHLSREELQKQDVEIGNPTDVESEKTKQLIVQLDDTTM